MGRLRELADHNSFMNFISMLGLIMCAMWGKWFGVTVFGVLYLEAGITNAIFRVAQLHLEALAAKGRS